MEGYALTKKHNWQEYNEALVKHGKMYLISIFWRAGLEISISSAIAVRSPLAVALIGLGLDLPLCLKLHNLIQ